MRRTHRPGLISAIAVGFLVTAASAAGQELADYDYENLSLRGVGLDYGYMWPTKLGHTQTFGLRFDLGYLGPGIRLVPSVLYWTTSFKTEEVNKLELQLDQTFGNTVLEGSLGSVEWSDVSVHVDAHFVWSTPFNILTYLGLGVGLHTLNGTSPPLEGTFVEDLLDTVTAGANAIAGIEFQPFSRLRTYAEARYTVMGDIRYPAVRGGLAFMFGRRDPAVVGLSEPAEAARGAQAP